MTITHARRLTANLLTGSFFLLYFIYFNFFNGYHLMFFEQDQLFRLNWHYFHSFLNRPGGLLVWLNAFFVQFFIQPWLAAAIVTFIAYLIFILNRRILRFHQFYGFLFPFIPLLLLAMALSSQIVGFLPFTGLLVILAVFNGYIALKNKKIRYGAGLLLIILLYLGAGVFAFVFGLMIILFETEKKGSFLFSGICVVLMALAPFVMRNWVYFITWKEAFFAPFEFSENLTPVYISFLAMLFLPCLIILSIVIKKNDFRWDLKYITAASIVFLALTFFLLRFGYDSRNNKLQEIDFHVQKANWEKVLKLSGKYPGKNQLVLYYTNLALYKTGRMGDQLFFYPQSGTKGLWLEWKRNEVNPYYGGEIFYHLGFGNEAFRWAFEAMEAKGVNPRSLQRLIVTAIVNGNNDVALKYTRILRQSLFYRKLARHYERLIADPVLLKEDREIAQLQPLIPQKDFISYMNQDDIGFFPLLENHPGNKMAFEYMMASFLLTKNMNGFAANIYRLKELGYDRIPVHFEEAIIIFTGVTKKNIVPEGYAISQATQQRFHAYAEILNMYGDNMNMAVKALNRDFGNTFWFYMQFINLEK